MNSRTLGFTLLEVLIAITILGIALAAVLRTTYVSTDQAREIKLKMLAQWSAQNVLAEQRARKLWPAPGSLRGTVQQAGQTLHWQADIANTPNVDFRRVEISIYADPASKHAQARLIGFLTNPSPQ